VPIEEEEEEEEETEEEEEEEEEEIGYESKYSFRVPPRALERTCTSEGLWSLTFISFPFDLPLYIIYILVYIEAFVPLYISYLTTLTVAKFI
jgi:hypothetical protein